MDIRAVGQRADGLAQTIVIVMQKRQPLGQTKERRLVARLSRLKIISMLLSGNLKRVQACH